MGYDITDERLGRGQFLYTLVSEPQPINIAPLPTKNQMELL